MGHFCTVNRQCECTPAVTPVWFDEWKAKEVRGRVASIPPRRHASNDSGDMAKGLRQSNGAHALRRGGMTRWSHHDPLRVTRSHMRNVNTTRMKSVQGGGGARGCRKSESGAHGPSARAAAPVPAAPAAYARPRRARRPHRRPKTPQAAGAPSTNRSVSRRCCGGSRRRTARSEAINGADAASSCRRRLSDASSSQRRSAAPARHFPRRLFFVVVSPGGVYI